MAIKSSEHKLVFSVRGKKWTAQVSQEIAQVKISQSTQVHLMDVDFTFKNAL